MTVLKDFLSDNSASSCFSDSGFKSFQRKPVLPATATMRSLIEMERNSNPRASKSAIQAIINAVKSISFTTLKSPLILPRSLSRKLSKKSKGGEIKITLRIKDIIRWRSFRDLAEEQPAPLDFGSSPQRYTTATTATSSCSSNGSSWSDSDFTTGYLSSCDGSFLEVAQNDVEVGNRFSPLVGKDSVDAATGTAVGAKEALTCQEEELESPVSVLEIGEDEFSPFDKRLANIERRRQKFMQSLDRGLSKEEEEEEDRVEKRARELVDCVKASGNLEQVLLGFFRDELETRKDDGFEWEILRIAEDWVDGSFEYDIEHNNKDSYVRDMDRRGKWSSNFNFEEEQQELGWEIETAIFENLVIDLWNAFH